MRKLMLALLIVSVLLGSVANAADVLGYVMSQKSFITGHVTPASEEVTGATTGKAGSIYPCYGSKKYNGRWWLKLKVSSTSDYSWYYAGDDFFVKYNMSVKTPYKTQMSRTTSTFTANGKKVGEIVKGAYVNVTAFRFSKKAGTLIAQINVGETYYVYANALQKHP